MVGVERRMCFLLFRAENKETRRRVSKFYILPEQVNTYVFPRRDQKIIVNAYVV